MRTKDVAVYLFLAAGWGMSFLVILKAVEAFGWVGAVALRSLVAGGTLLLLAAIMRRKLDFSAGWRPFAVVGATTVAGQLVGVTFATPRIGTAMAAISVATIPLFSMVIGQVWGLERLTGRRLIGLVLGMVGIVLLVGFPATPVTGSFVLGCASALLGSFSAAFGSNYASRHLGAAGSWEVTAAAFLLGGLMTLPLLFAVPVPAAPAPADYLYLLVLGIVMSALNYVLYFRLVSSIGATRALSVEFMVTLVAVFIGALLLHEPLSAMQLAGTAVIVGGCALVLGLVPRGSRGAPGPATGAVLSSDT